VLSRRLITGPLLILALAGLAMLDGMLADRLGESGIAFGLAAALILVPIAAIEAAALLRGAGARASTIATVIGAEAMLLAPLAATFAPAGPEHAPDAATAVGIGLLGPTVAILAASIAIGRSKQVEGGFTGVAAMLGAAFWTGLLPAFWILTIHEIGAPTAAGLLMVVKAGDIGAYFTGMSIGRRKLIPWLSPGKTVEGGIGAVVWASAAGAGLAALQPAIPMWVGVAGGAVLGVVGAVGDLLESLLKREAGAKDSGHLLPGMGGALDVLDSPLLAAPVAWAIVAIST
jgi:phosphatidate cytidylyltransferase